MYILFFCITATHFFIYSKSFVDLLEHITQYLLVPFINKLYKINNIEKYLEVNVYSLDLLSDLDDFEEFIIGCNDEQTETSTSSELPELIDITKEEQDQMAKEDKQQETEETKEDTKEDTKEEEIEETKETEETEETKEDINKLFFIDKQVLDLATNNYIKTESEIDTDSILIEKIE